MISPAARSHVRKLTLLTYIVTAHHFHFDHHHHRHYHGTAGVNSRCERMLTFSQATQRKLLERLDLNPHRTTAKTVSVSSEGRKDSATPYQDRSQYEETPIRS